MYVIESKLGLQTLHEMTKREYAERTRFDTVSTWRPVSAEHAHRFVRYGGVHTTGLYLDEGRIRKAQPCADLAEAEIRAARRAAASKGERA